MRCNTCLATIPAGEEILKSNEAITRFLCIKCDEKEREQTSIFIWVILAIGIILAILVIVNKDKL